jgi:GT2 family glycosyltransferase
MDAPAKISVVVTCYNLGHYLDEAVDSVLTQTFQDFEIVIVDDGSTDPQTVRLLSDYRRPRTRVVHIENRGLPGARNEGVRQTRGPYVCLLDADDRLEASYFEKAVAVLDRDPAIAFVSHWLRTFGDEEWEWKPESPDFPALLDRNSINGAALVRREALVAVGLFDESMRSGCEDWDLWISMVERGLRGTILPEVLFFYRRRPDSMSRLMMQGDTHVGLYRYLIEKHRDSFAANVVELVLRRQVEKMTVLREAHDLELDCQEVFSADVGRLRDGLRVAQHRLARLQRARNVEAELARQTRALHERDAELAHCKQALDEREVDLARSTGALAKHEAELASCTRALEEREVELQLLHRRLADAEAQLPHLSRRAADLEAQLQLERQGIAGLHHEIRALRSSLSWRLMRPVRIVYSWLFERG